MRNLWGSHRYDASDPGLTDQNPSAFNPPNAPGNANRGLLAPSSLDICSIPTKGMRIAQPFDFGDVGTSLGNGYVSTDYTTNFPAHAFKLNGACQLNPDSAVGRAGGAFTQANKNVWRTDFAREERGSVRDMNSFGENLQISDAMLYDRKLQRGDGRWLEAWDYSGGMCQVSMRPGTLPIVTPRASYIWSDEQFYRTLVSLPEARRKLDECNGSCDAPLLHRGAHKSKVVLGINVPQTVTGVHKFPQGEALTKRGHQTFEMGAQFGWWNSFVALSGFQSHEYFTQAQKKDSGTARVVFRSENKSGWRSDGVVCVGIRGYRRSTVIDSYQEFTDYADTEIGHGHLKTAEPSFYAKRMPPMGLGPALKTFNQPLDASSSDARLSGLMRTQEVTVELGLSLRMHLLPIRPGYWTLAGRDHKRSSRREFDLKREHSRSEEIERLTDTRRTSREYFGKQPTVHEVTAAEEWIPAKEQTPAALHGLRFVSQWHAKSPRTPEQLNEVISYYNDIFGIKRALLDTPAGAAKATRRMKIDIELSPDDVIKLGEQFIDIGKVTGLALQTKLSATDIAALCTVFSQDTTLQQRSTALRIFIATHGVRGMAFLHRLTKRSDATLDISADEEIFSNVTAYCAKTLLRYQAPLDDNTELGELQDRLYHVSDALRSVQHAYGCIQQDAMLGEERRSANLARLQQQETELRALYDVGNNDTCKRFYQKLTDVWFMTQQDCEFAAVFQKEVDLGSVSSIRVVDAASAVQYLHKYDASIQTLRRIELGTENNILLTQQQRQRHLHRIRDSIGKIEQDFRSRRADTECPYVKAYLLRPYQTCGTFWFTSWRGWRFFWLTFNSQDLLNGLNFWSNDTLLATAN